MLLCGEDYENVYTQGVELWIVCTAVNVFVTLDTQ
jgi:hypothetical protein